MSARIRALCNPTGRAKRSYITTQFDDSLYLVGSNTFPAVTITAPTDGSTFTAGTSIALTGTASDTEDGDLTASLTWSSNLDGSIGSGGSFSTSNLSVGTPAITAAVTTVAA